MELSLLSFGENGWGDEFIFATFTTLQLAAVSLVFALILGGMLAGLKLSNWRLLRILANAYTLFIRGVPEFLIILIIFFGSEKTINGVIGLLGYDFTIEVPKFAAAAAGLALIFAAYVCEIIRGAYLAVPSGQMEAAQAIGMRPLQAMIRIKLPQLWRYALPGLGNLWMVVLKDTSLAAVIALDEVLRVAKLAGETERELLLFFVLAGGIYLMLTSLSELIIRRLEIKARRGLNVA